MVSGINLLQNDVNVYHLNSSTAWCLYTIPCETWNPHHAGATTVLSEKETAEFIPSQLWHPHLPDFNPVDYSVSKYCKRRCTKHASLIWINWNSDWERSGPSWITSSVQQPFVSVVVDSCRSVIHVLYTSLAIFPIRCYQLDSNLANLQATVEVGYIPEFLDLTTQL